MKLVIAGPRDFWPSVDEIGRIVHRLELHVTEVVSGEATGVDAQGKSWAVLAGIPVKPMPADWGDLNATGAVIRTRRDGSRYNAKAGPDRNRRMAEYGDGLLAIRNRVTDGQSNMIREMERLDKPVWVVDL